MNGHIIKYNMSIMYNPIHWIIALTLNRLLYLILLNTQINLLQVETKFEMLLEEYNSEKLILIGMPLEKLPLNCHGLPLIVENINDYIIDKGIYGY